MFSDRERINQSDLGHRVGDQPRLVGIPGTAPFADDYLVYAHSLNHHSIASVGASGVPVHQLRGNVGSDGCRQVSS